MGQNEKNAEKEAESKTDSPLRPEEQAPIQKEQKDRLKKFLFFTILGFGKPKIPYLPTLGGEVKKPSTIIIYSYMHIFKIILINYTKISSIKKSEVRKKLDFQNVNLKRGSHRISKKNKPKKTNETKTEKVRQNDKKQIQNKSGRELSLAVKKIANLEVLKDEAVLFEVISDCAPKAVNAFITKWEVLIIIFAEEKDRDEFIRKAERAKYFGDEAVLEAVEEKHFV